MKKIICKMLCCMMFFALLSTTSVSASQKTIEDEFRGVWVSTVHNLDFPSKKGLSSEALKAEIDTILDKTVALDLNAVILQVRPAGDAFYKSELFPWSEYLTGEQG